MLIELDDEAIEMIEEYEHYQGDDSFGLHLAAKVTELYHQQGG